MKVERQTLHHCLDKAKEYFKAGDKDKSRDYCDMGLVWVATKRSEGYSATDTLEGVRVELWLERFWMFLENKGLML